MPAPQDLSPPPLAPGDRPLAAVGWMALTGLFFVGVIATVKYLGDRVPPPQSAFLRYALGLVFLIPMWSTIRSVPLTRRAFGLFTLRGTLHGVGVLCWFYAMTRITIAEVTAMNYLNPVFVTLGAAVFLGERLQIRRIMAVVAALVGTLLVLRPGVRELDPGHLAMLFCALFFAGSYLLAKRMTDAYPAAAVVGLLSIMVTLALAPAAIVAWQTPTLAELAWLFLVAAFATAGHYTMTLAFGAAPLAVSQPVIFLQLIWSVAVGAILFGEAIDPWVIAGGLVIVGAVTFIAWREAKLKADTRRRKP